MMLYNNLGIKVQTDELDILLNNACFKDVLPMIIWKNDSYPDYCGNEFRDYCDKGGKTLQKCRRKRRNKRSANRESRMRDSETNK